MNFDLLFDNFGLLLNSPDQTAKLNQAILQLAVQGKLVPQDPTDEPATELIKHIQAEQLRLIRKKKIKKEESLRPISGEEIPYNLPKGWLWVRLGDLGQTQTGTTPSKNKFEFFGSDYPFIKPGDITDNFVNYSNEGLSKLGVENGRLIKSGSVLMVCIGGSIGKVNFVDRNCSCNQQINVITPYLNLDCKLFTYFMRSPYFQGQVSSRAPQTTLPILSKGKWELIPLPLPPLNEQKRIVSKIEDLLSKIQEIKIQLRQADQEIVNLNKAALSQLLDTKYADEFQEKWQFILDNFDLLYSDERNISDLKQAILQLAVQGKLVPQDPTREPTTELLKRIKVEKERLIREKKIKKEKPLPPISPDEVLYELPEGWVWCRLSEIYHDLGQKKPNEEFTYIDVSAIDKERGVITDNLQILKPENAPSRARKIVKKGTVIYSTVRPYLLNIAIVDKDYYLPPIVSTAFAVMHPFEGVVNKYLYYYLRSKPFIEFVESKMVGMAYPAVNDSQLNTGLFPLPPLNEQKRIVAKVDELMRLCDELEEQIRQSKEESERLMQAVLREAFEGKDVEESNAEVSVA